MRFFLTTLPSLVISIHAAAHETNKSNERDISTHVLPTCIKPKTNPSFDYVECLNKKDMARVGNIIQTPFGEFPYPLGLVDKDGKVILANEYHQIDFPEDWEWDRHSLTSDALILVAKRDLANNPMFGNLGVNGLYGLVDSQGTFIVPFGQYDEINPFYDNGLASVAKDGKYGFIDTKGNVAIPLTYDYAYHFVMALPM